MQLTNEKTYFKKKISHKKFYKIFLLILQFFFCENKFFNGNLKINN